MKRTQFLTALPILALPGLAGAAITSLVESGGDNDTDTIAARYTGQTWNITAVNKPFTGAVVGNPYTVTAFGNQAPGFVDRNHRYENDPGTPTVGVNALNIPAYLIGNEYIMTGNDNRDNASYSLLATVDTPSRVFMLIDNRLSDGNNANPPTFGATNMQWIVDEGWLATSNGLNRFGNTGVPDEVPFNEGADATINQWYSVYYRDVAAGSFTLRQADNTGRNMYGVVVMPIPEPASATVAGLGLAGLLLRRRRN